MKYWMQTYTGIKFDLLVPTIDMVSIEDIAHHLSQINRFNGATRLPYSVASHCVKMSYIVPTLEALMHDAHEAYTGDISTPLKQLLHMLGLDIRVIQYEYDAVIASRFNLGDMHSDAIRTADARLCLTEAECLMRGGIAGWKLAGETEPYDDFTYPPPQLAKQRFLDRFEELNNARIL